MAGIGRERVEVAPDIRHFVALVDLEAHPEEDVLDLAANLCQEMQPPAPERFAGQSDIERTLRVEPFESVILDRFATSFDGSLQLRADPVEEHAALPFANRAQRLREVA